MHRKTLFLHKVPASPALLTFQSLKIYKSKFKEWDWQKNLSTDMAVVMAGKAERRRREEGKETVFSFGGRIWNTDRVASTLARIKNPRVDEDLEGKLESLDCIRKRQRRQKSS